MIFYKIHTHVGSKSEISDSVATRIDNECFNVDFRVDFFPRLGNKEEFYGFIKDNKGKPTSYTFNCHNYDPRDVYISPKNIAIKEGRAHRIDKILDVYLMADDTVIVDECIYKRDKFRYENIHEFEAAESFDVVLRPVVLEPCVLFAEDEDPNNG